MDSWSRRSRCEWEAEQAFAELVEYFGNIKIARDVERVRQIRGLRALQAHIDDLLQLRLHRR
jgi:hypothetical protein